MPLHHTQDAYYTSQLFEKYPHLIHGYSSRLLGDMRKDSHRQVFLDRLEIGDRTLIMGQQVHGNLVERATKSDSSPIPLADGIVLSAQSNKKSYAVGVIVADCVPILLADTKGKSIGVAHAGWKGSYKNIAGEIVRAMKELETRPADIVVSIGPHIGMCCYTVPEERAKQFLTLYGKDPKVASEIDGVWHLDIGYVNGLQLKNAGVAEKNIEYSSLCTSCQSDIFYSFRKDTKETFGEILGVMAFQV